MNRDGRLKQIGEAAAKASRHRQFHWCRRPNGFCDLPIWGVVADRLGMPAYQVIAFVNRLEELANAAANYGGIRGHLGRFNPLEFARGLGMSPDDAERIYDALAAPDIGWISEHCVVDFYDRNPDREDATNAERQRRFRLRKSIMQQLSKLARAGRIDAAERCALEEALDGSEADLRNLQVKLARADLGPNLSTAPVDNSVAGDAGEGKNELSTANPVTRYYQMSQCDIVTVTPEKSKVLDSGAVDNFGHGVRVDPAGWPKVDVVGATSPTGADSVAEAESWLIRAGHQLIADRLGIPPGQAETKAARWRRELDDDVVKLAQIIASANAFANPDKAVYFHVMVIEAIGRHQQEAKGRQLPFLDPVDKLMRGAR